MSGAERLRDLRAEIGRIGYSAIVENYVFSDVFASPSRDRSVPLAVFTHTPPSYRNAAFAAVVEPKGRNPEQIASEHRALGAPLLFVIEGDDVRAWQVRAEGGPRLVAETATREQLRNLFTQRREAWGPRSIQRAKSAGQIDQSYQLHFVDLGLLPAIEGEIHAKLDRLLRETLIEANDARTNLRSLDEGSLFRVVFRLLAAKILHDRSHQLSRTWASDDIGSVLDAISRYYDLPLLSPHRGSSEHAVFSAAWQHLRTGINFQNISADDLAFVYENTLVTPETREKYGTHSTPWQVVEYVVNRLHLANHSPEHLRIYEPCAGAAVFLVSTLRHLREALPLEWTDQQRHNFLVERLSGDDVDPFAVEAAKLSLILADYPNHNGWRIGEVDLFETNVLPSRMHGNNVIVCNPPFEAFPAVDRDRYPITRTTHLKPAAVLNAALDAHPLALGFVMPRAFLRERQFLTERRRVESLYGSIELVELPDKTFRESESGAALLIAREPRPPAPPLIKLRSTEVADRDRLRFLRSGKPTDQRELERAAGDEPTGDLWLPRLKALWDYLEPYPRLETKLRASRGLEWTYDQRNAYSLEPRPGFQEGLHKVRGSAQFIPARTVYLDYRREFVRRGYGQPWAQPKLIVSAGRRGRGGWRISAFLDAKGLLFSQQFYGMWPVKPASLDEWLTLCAVLNGPLASAYLATQAPEKGHRILAVERIPIPRNLPIGVAELVSEYISKATTADLLQDEKAMKTTLERIDAAVLAAYNLPPRFERELLEFFRGSERPTVHNWAHWFPEHFAPFIPLQEYLSDEYKTATRPWIQEVFTPLPPEDAAALLRVLE